MNCKKCGKDIGGLLACKNCAKTASVMRERQTTERYEKASYDQILRGVRPVWVQDCTCSGEPKTQHLAFAMWIDFISVSFCGHNITVGTCHGNGGENTWRPEYEKDPEICPLCLDRLLNRGGGICANICSLCGTPDGNHQKGCAYRRLQNKELVEKLGGLPSNEKPNAR